MLEKTFEAALDPREGPWLYRFDDGTWTIHGSAVDPANEQGGTVNGQDAFVVLTDAQMRWVCREAAGVLGKDS